MKQGIKKRVARIEAKGEATGKEAKQLARKRAASYQSGTSSSSKKTGPGKKNTLKREVYKAGGTKSEVAALKAQPKTVRKSIKKNAQTRDNYDIRTTAKNMKKTVRAGGEGSYSSEPAAKSEGWKSPVRRKWEADRARIESKAKAMESVNKRESSAAAKFLAEIKKAAGL